MRRALAMVVLALVVGCGEAPPTFIDEVEELNYLEAQASPTVEQFRRRNALAAKRDQRAADDEKTREILGGYR